MQKRMGEEQLDSVIKDRAKLQRDRSAGSNQLNLSKPKDLIFYIRRAALLWIRADLAGLPLFQPLHRTKARHEQDP